MQRVPKTPRTTLVSWVQRAKLARKKKCVSALKGWRMFFDFLSAKVEKNIEKNKESRVFFVVMLYYSLNFCRFRNKTFLMKEIESFVIELPKKKGIRWHYIWTESVDYSLFLRSSFASNPLKVRSTDYRINGPITDLKRTCNGGTWEHKNKMACSICHKPFCLLFRDFLFA